MFQIFDGGQVLGQHVLRGLKDTRVPMIVAGIGYWLIGMPACALLAFAVVLGGIGADVDNLVHMRHIADKLFGDDYEWSILAAGRHLIATQQQVK